MALDPKLLDILACPEDKGPLLYFADEGTLYNPRLKRRYAVKDDIPIMLIDEATTVDETEDKRLTAKAEAEGIKPTFAAEARSAVTDSINFLDAVAGLPEQFVAAREAAGRIDPARFPSPDGVANIIVCGMGGSGIAGDVLVASQSGELGVPVVVSKQIRTPGFVGPDTLVFAMSYSGDTAETLSMARGARDAGARLVCVSRGGELQRLAEESGALHIGCADGYLPRAALGTLVVPVFVTLMRMRLLASAHTSLLTAQRQLAARRDECAPANVGPANLAREVARKIGRTIPLIYGGGALGGVAAYRWKCDVNENAKAPAYCAQYPELDHNEICAWGQHGDVTRQLISLIEVRHGFEHAELDRRFTFTREIIEEAVHQVIEVRAAGESRLAQLLDLMYLGDWVSCYLALDNDVDPGPIAAIADLRARLAES